MMFLNENHVSTRAPEKPLRPTPCIGVAGVNGQGKELLLIVLAILGGTAHEGVAKSWTVGGTKTGTAVGLPHVPCRVLHRSWPRVVGLAEASGARARWLPPTVARGGSRDAQAAVPFEKLRG